jgi:hypothetical protein
MLKKILVCLSFCGSAVQAMAGGPIDGIYSCGVSAAGKNTQVYVTINGHADGTTIYVPAAISPTNEAHGYGMGTATSTSFSGTTMYGLPFNFAINPATGIMTGTAGVNVSGTNVTGSVNCLKIW